MPITLYEAMEAYLQERAPHVLPYTTEASRRIARLFLIAMGPYSRLDRWDHELWDAISHRLQLYVASMSHLNPSTIRDRLKPVSGCFNWCIRHGYVNFNPVTFLKLPPLRKTEPVIYNHEEYLQITKAAKGTPLHWLVICAYRTGLSMVDICNLKWSSVDLLNMMIITNRQKLARSGGGRVYIPILHNSDMHQCLLILKEAPLEDAWPGPGYVCHELALRYHVSSFAVVTSYARLMSKLGINKTFKSWRNTFLSGLANSGVQTVIACKMSGHSNPAMLAHYVKPDPIALRDVLTQATDFMEKRDQNKITIKKP